MIPRDFITEWRNEAPWPSDEQVEQDLVKHGAHHQQPAGLNRHLVIRVGWCPSTAQR